MLAKQNELLAQLVLELGPVQMHRDLKVATRSGPNNTLCCRRMSISSMTKTSAELSSSSRVMSMGARGLL